MNHPAVTMVLSGGVALGAYQGGAYAALHDRFGSALRWIAGSSIGAVNGAIIAGSAPEERVARLRGFWAATASPGPFVQPRRGIWRHALNWVAATQTRLQGRPGVFKPRPIADIVLDDHPSLYDLTPLATTMERFIDFPRLNAGNIRFSAVATDIESGEAAVFDTGNGDLIAPEHLLASCGFLPEFQPVEIDGRLLGDGALIANAPVEVVLRPDTHGDEEGICFVLDLFARHGPRPGTLERGAERRRDLLLANQTWKTLQSLRRERELQSMLVNVMEDSSGKTRGRSKAAAEARRADVEVVLLAYRSSQEEAGPEKHFDFSPASLADRWAAGAADMRRALEAVGNGRCRTGGFTLQAV